MALVLFFIVVTLVVIAFAEPVGERTGIVAPVILLGVGCVVALVPQVPNVAVDPEIILQFILPPLLFATAMKMPQHDFRRNFSAIFVLAVCLVAATSLEVGAVIHAVVPEIPLAYAVARVERQRRALVDARDTGIIDAADFGRHLAILGSRQLAIEATAREKRSSEAE